MTVAEAGGGNGGQPEPLARHLLGARGGNQSERSEHRQGLGPPGRLGGIRGRALRAGRGSAVFKLSVVLIQILHNTATIFFRDYNFQKSKLYEI